MYIVHSKAITNIFLKRSIIDPLRELVTFNDKKLSIRRHYPKYMYEDTNWFQNTLYTT